MFKYLWMLILGVFGLFILVYTIYAIEDTLDEYELYDWRDFLCVFFDDHGLLCTFWCVFFLFLALISLGRWIF